MENLLITLHIKKSLLLCFCAVSHVEHAFNPYMLLYTSLSCYVLWTLYLFNRYLDRLADSLQQKLKVSEKLVASIKTMADKRQAASTEQHDLEPKLEVIRMKTKELQAQVRS